MPSANKHYQKHKSLHNFGERYTSGAWCKEPTHFSIKDPDVSKDWGQAEKGGDAG